MKSSTTWMFAFWGVMFIFGAVDHVFIESSFVQVYYLSSVLVVTLFMLTWFLVDAKELGHKPSTGLKIGVVAIGFLAIPYYLLKYKGSARAFVSFSKFLGFLVVYAGFMLALEYMLSSPA